MRKRISAIIMTLFMVLASCSNQLEAEKLAAESKNTFFDSLVKIGQGFQDIFGIFGNAIGDALGFNAVKSGDKKSKVGEHFKKIGDGLTTTKDKLKELSNKISEAKNADGSSIEAVKGAIKGAGDVFDKLIGALTKLSDTAKEAGDTNIGDANNAGAAVAADENSVKAVIANVKEIIDAADKSGVKIELGNAGNQVTAGAQTDAPAALAANNNAQANSGPKLAEEVSKADPWAMINKIKNAKTGINLAVGDNNEVGALATKIADANSTGAKTNADLAAAVALKAITKGGKFSHAANEDGAVKAAAVSAVNKVLGVLDVIIRKAVNLELDKIKEAVKGIKYSESTGEATESDTAQPITNKSLN
ncbi:variable large family protein [Borrelia hermsii]|uniref:Variable large protein n=3 Tax=Borrelia hermsii TaxID=140 RepID=Q1CNY4_BORHD|nr:variable large family protein [Borrelia hermsii]ABF82177.1 VlpB32silD [Borrelia hermsii DAH]ANA43922.1 VlpB41 [Borrelia hermsii HS1]UPA08687.1 variable large family protein [Borrelia hermsii DAH]